MPDLYLDPYLFACPSPDRITDFERYIDNIVAWRDLTNVNSAAIYTTRSTIDVLFQTESYPLWDDLKKVLGILGIVNIQIKDIVNLVDSFLQKLPTIEDRLGIKELLTSNVNSTPSDHLTQRNEIFVEQYERLLVLMCLVQEVPNSLEQQQLMLTRDLNSGCISVNVTGEIADCEFFSPEKVFHLPHSVACDLIACDSPDGLYSVLDTTGVWMSATTDDQRLNAISIYLQQRLQASGLWGTTAIRNWSVGRKFFETADRLGFTFEPPKIKALLRACAETILRENLDATHWLRISEGANAPQRERGSDKAWRRDIDYEFHLHYWETKNGPELASVVVHSDMSIPF